MLKKFSFYSFVLPLLILWLLAILMLVFFERGEVLFWINRWSFDALDNWVKIISIIGNGWFLLFISVFFFIVNVRNGLLYGMAFLIASLVTNIFKRFVFFNHYRPMWYLDFADYHRIVTEAPIHYLHSFPSGHTLAIFTFITVTTVLFNKKLLHFSLLVIALLVSFSRIYLLQHFLVDVLWGGLLGVFAGWAGFKLFIYFEKITKLEIPEKSVFSVLGNILYYYRSNNKKKLN